MKLSDALSAAKKAQAYHNDNCMSYQGCCGYEETADDLIVAVEEHLEAERKSAETLLCLADLQRHGGE